MGPCGEKGKSASTIQSVALGGTGLIQRQALHEARQGGQLRWEKDPLAI
jgi:hypothetical protein